MCERINCGLTIIHKNERNNMCITINKRHSEMGVHPTDFGEILTYLCKRARKNWIYLYAD